MNALQWLYIYGICCFVVVYGGAKIADGTVDIWTEGLKKEWKKFRDKFFY